ncbi:hypothetical protein E3N88_45632 [Mikania micrantha]|uniref:Tyrosine decarboxylase n=1 Tax=Mikania micrantha TaxID=192012 RepID=A0A5N6L8Q3_9ASTR|nr:hypothetical protein E3N88_45632 [Mikania micrantha]
MVDAGNIPPLRESTIGSNAYLLGLTQGYHLVFIEVSEHGKEEKIMIIPEFVKKYRGTQNTVGSIRKGEGDQRSCRSSRSHARTLFPATVSSFLPSVWLAAFTTFLHGRRRDSRYRIWLHVDAAYAGSACICPEYRHHLNGIEEADSFNMNCHKWFLTNFDCSALWIKDRNALIQSLSTNPEYLDNKASQGRKVIDYKDWEIPLGHRFRSLKLWMVLRLNGVENLQSYIRNHIKLAQQFEDLVAQDTRFEIVAPRTFSLVCFRLLPANKNKEYANKLNRDLLDAVNSSGQIYISHTVYASSHFRNIKISLFLDILLLMEHT